MRDPEFFNEIAKCTEVMKKGGIILYPTDTIWGIGCDATNATAVAKIYALKQRADNKSMLALADGIPMLERHVNEVPEIAYQLIEASQGATPLTIIYDGAIGLAPNLLGENHSIGIRITSEAFSAALCRSLRRPVVSTSANISGKRSPQFFSQISPEIISGVDYVANFRRTDTTPHSPSSIIKLNADGSLKIIR